MDKVLKKRDKTSVSLLPQAIRLIKKAAYERDSQFNEIIEEAIFAHLSVPVPTPKPSISSVPFPGNQPSNMLDVKRRLQTAKAEIEGALSALDGPEMTRGKVDRNAAEEHLDAAEQELDEIEDAGPLGGSTRPSGKGRKRIS